MKRSVLAVLIVFLASSATATNIQSENVTVDLENSQVNVDILVGELTSSRFTYITNYPIVEESINVRINGEPVNCRITKLQLGSEISCPTDLKDNFTASMNFEGREFVSQDQGINIFRYSQSIVRPTENYNLRVILPPGTGLVNKANVTGPVVSPESDKIGSNGRRIFIEWHTEPSLGDTLNFKVMFERFSSPINYLQIIAGVALLVLLAAVGYITWRRKSRESVESLYEELPEDQIEVLELIRENGGSMLQKDIVHESEYSKAKISGVVSELVDEEIIEKKKEGRSNKLTLSKKYSR